jgi:pyruvate decarboxylase
MVTLIAVQARPGYITIPTDIAYEKVSSSRLQTPLSLLPSPNDGETEAFVLKQIVKAVQDAGENVIILVDACTIRHYVRHEVAELARKTRLPVFSSTWDTCMSLTND